MTPDQMAGLAARLREHANLHREHLPQDHEQQQWTADLARAADLIAGMAQRESLRGLLAVTSSKAPGTGLIVGAEDRHAAAIKQARAALENKHDR